MVDKLRITGLAVLGAAVVGAILLLAWKVHQEPPPVTASADAVQQAQIAAAAAPPSVQPQAPPPTRRAARRAPAREPEPPPRERVPEPAADAPPTTEDVRQAYDIGDYLATLEVAREVLAAEPDNHYVRRAAAVAACALGERAEAREYHAAMNDRDKRVIAIRCRRFGLEL